jgi:hypothetical protein
MAVHHFTAPDLTVARGWQPMDTFPRDGSTVQVRDEAGNLAEAVWLATTNEPIASDGLTGPPTHWRIIDAEG